MASHQVDAMAFLRGTSLYVDDYLFNDLITYRKTNIEGGLPFAQVIEPLLCLFKKVSLKWQAHIDVISRFFVDT